MDEHRRKSIHKKQRQYSKKLKIWKKTGEDHFKAGWLATLGLILLMMEQQILGNPGHLVSEFQL